MRRVQGFKDENTEVLGSTMFGSGLCTRYENQGCNLRSLGFPYRCRGTLLGCHEEGWDRVCNVETVRWQPWAINYRMKWKGLRDEERRSNSAGAYGGGGRKGKDFPHSPSTSFNISVSKLDSLPDSGCFLAVIISLWK